MDASDGLRILCVGAHPDDIEFAAGGSVARWADEGAEITFAIVTDGSTGTHDPAMAGDRLVRLRRDESLAAAEVLGVDHVEFLGFRDGYVEPTLDLRREIGRLYRRVQPHRFCVMDPAPLPGGFFVNHPDHRAVGQACLDVTVTAGTTPGHFPELRAVGLEPWQGLEEIYVMGPAGGETPVDITSTVERKIEALQCHVSQIGDWDVASAIREWTERTGSEHAMERAESFHVVIPIATASREAEPPQS